jgi:hypothetical protein
MTMLHQINENNSQMIKQILFDILRTNKISILSPELLRQILKLLPEEALDGLYNTLSSSGGGRMRIKKSIRKY